MKVSFPYEERPSSLFGKVKRPVAKLKFWSKKFKRYLEYVLLVDTGADYTLFPKHIAFELGIDLQKNCKPFSTSGVGGKEKVYFAKQKLKMKIGSLEKEIPVGFLDKEDIPPLLGRESCLNDFDLRLTHFTTFMTL
ncbi:MAG: retropepsin-like aspartic protease [Patescibacteria group bacterium]